jgi:hypothetical protein
MVTIDTLASWVGIANTLMAAVNPQSVPDAKVRVRFATGRDIKGLSGAGGDLPNVILTDTENRRLGFLDGTGSLQHAMTKNFDIQTISGGTLKMLNVDMGSSANGKGYNDGLCLGQMIWAPEDKMWDAEQRRGIITGDLFYYCGYSWYMSGLWEGDTELRCGWLDGDNSNGNSVYGFNINTDILGAGFIEGYARKYPNPSDICSWGIGFKKGNYHAKRSYHQKRSIQDKYGNKAYVSASTGAIALCDSPTSYGPSFLSLEEGIFCDMHTKTKIPICGKGKIDGCVKYNSGQLRNNSGQLKKGLRPQRYLTTQNVTRGAISYDSYDLEYFTTTTLNGTVIDDGSKF